MVALCLVVKWSSIQIVVLKFRLKKPVYGPKCPVFEWSAKSSDYHLNTGDQRPALLTLTTSTEKVTPR